MEGRIPLLDFHYQRLFNGSRFLGLETLTLETFSASILDLCKRNGHSASARVRLTVFRGERADSTGVVLQSWPWEPTEEKAGGLSLGVYPKGRKACDGLSHLKSNNYLLYTLAATYAGDHGWDDCIVLNSRERVADTSIANLWYVAAGVIYTPPLSEGCVAGVMREWLMRTLPEKSFRVIEKAVAPEDLILADEVFLSNALRGVRRVGSFAGTTYGNEVFGVVKKIVDEGFC